MPISCMASYYLSLSIEKVVGQIVRVKCFTWLCCSSLFRLHSLLLIFFSTWLGTNLLQQTGRDAHICACCSHNLTCTNSAWYLSIMIIPNEKQLPSDFPRCSEEERFDWVGLWNSGASSPHVNSKLSARERFSRTRLLFLANGGKNCADGFHSNLEIRRTAGADNKQTLKTTWGEKKNGSKRDFERY